MYYPLSLITAAPGNDPETFKALVLFSFAIVNIIVILLTFYAYKKRQNKMDAGLGSLLDNFGATGVKNNWIGHNSGSARHDGFSFDFQTGKNSERGRFFRVSAHAPANGSFEIKKKDTAASALKALRLIQTVKTGISPVDENLIVISDPPELAYEVINSTGLPASLEELFETGVSAISHDGQMLSIELSPFDPRGENSVEKIERSVKGLAEIKSVLPAFSGVMPANIQAQNITLRTITGLPLAMFAAGLVFFMTGLFAYRPLDPNLIFFDSLKLSIPAAAAYILFASGRFRGKPNAVRDMTFTLCFSLVGWPLMMFGSAMFFNGYTDDSPEIVRHVAATGKFMKKSDKATGHHIDLESWRNPGGHETLRAGRNIYDRIEPGVTAVQVVSKRGAFGYEWIQAAYIAEKDGSLTPFY